MNTFTQRTPPKKQTFCREREHVLFVPLRTGLLCVVDDIWATDARRYLEVPAYYSCTSYTNGRPSRENGLVAGDDNRRETQRVQRAKWRRRDTRQKADEKKTKKCSHPRRRRNIKINTVRNIIRVRKIHFITTRTRVRVRKYDGRGGAKRRCRPCMKARRSFSREKKHNELKTLTANGRAGGRR